MRRRKYSRARVVRPSKAEITARNERQGQVVVWAGDAFTGVAGPDGKIVDPMSEEQRCLRFLEEAIELCQAVMQKPGHKSEDVIRFGVKAHDLIVKIFRKDPGEIQQEVGGVAVTLMALAERMSVSLARAEHLEFQRVLAKPLDIMAGRQKEKLDAGF